MSLKFADIALPVATPEAEEKLEKTCSLGEIWEWQAQFWPGARQPWLTCPGVAGCKQPPFRLQRLWWPRHASQWSHIHFLVTDNRLASIREAYGTGPATLSMTWVDYEGTQQAAIEPEMYMLAPRPLATIEGLEEPLRQLWLLTLVDQRYFWWLVDTNDMLITEYTSLLVTPTTWDNLYTGLGALLGTSITHDTVNPYYLLPSKSLQAKFEYLPPFLDAVAYNTGMRISRTLSGAIEARLATTAQLTLESNQTLGDRPLGGGSFLYDPSADPNDLDLMVPANVRVVFPKMDCGLVTGDVDTKTVSLTTLALPQFSGATGTIGVKTFHDTCCADYTGVPVPITPTNTVELQNLCNQIATDYYLFNRQIIDQKYDGLVEMTPEGYSGAYEWTYRRWPTRNVPGQHDVVTRIIPQTYNDLTFDLLHASATVLPRGSGLLEKYGNIGFPGNLFFDKQRSWKPTDVILVGDQSDYPVPTDGPWWRIIATPAAADWINLTGLAGGTEGLVFHVTNGSLTGKPIKLLNECPLSLAQNRFLLATPEVVIQPFDTKAIYYDCKVHRWLVGDVLRVDDTYDINVTTTLNGNINSSQATLTVNSHAQFPTDYRFKIVIDSEAMLIETTGGSLTWTIVERPIDQTLPAAHLNGATIRWLTDITYDVNEITVDKFGLAMPGTTTGGLRQAILPITDQLVRLVSNVVTSFGYYDAYTLKWDSTTKTWVDDQHIWVRDVDT